MVFGNLKGFGPLIGIDPVGGRSLDVYYLLYLFLMFMELSRELAAICVGFISLLSYII